MAKSKRYITDCPVLQELRNRLKRSGSQLNLAAELGYSASYINDVLHEQRNMSSQLAYKLGFQLRWVKMTNDKPPQ